MGEERMTPEEIQKHPLVKCKECGNYLSLLPELDYIWLPVMRYGEFYHLKCLQPVPVPTETPLR